MHTLRLTFAGLILTTLLVNGIVILAAQGASWEDPQVVIQMGIAFAQVGLLATWLVVGRWNLLLRVGLLLAGIVLISLSLQITQSSNEVATWMGILSLYAALVTLPALLIRFHRRRGWSLPGLDRSSIKGRAVESPPEDFALEVGELEGVAPDGVATEGVRSEVVSEAVGPSATQYTLGTLLVSITALALVLGVARVMDFPWHAAIEVLLYGLCFTALLTLTIWAVWGRQWVWLRGLALLAAVPAIGAVMGRIENLSLSATIGMCAADVVFVLVWLIALRVANYGRARPQSAK